MSAYRCLSDWEWHADPRWFAGGNFCVVGLTAPRGCRAKSGDGIRWDWRKISRVKLLAKHGLEDGARRAAGEPGALRHKVSRVKLQVLVRSFMFHQAHLGSA
jgi:hypothetical protein